MYFTVGNPIISQISLADETETTTWTRSKRTTLPQVSVVDEQMLDVKKETLIYDTNTVFITRENVCRTIKKQCNYCELIEQKE